MWPVLSARVLLFTVRQLDLPDVAQALPPFIGRFKPLAQRLRSLLIALGIPLTPRTSSPIILSIPRARPFARLGSRFPSIFIMSNPQIPALFPPDLESAKGYDRLTRPGLY